MPTDIDVLYLELEGKLQPPVDVMLDPSLLVANTILDRVDDSGLFDAQAQATLGQSLTDPHVDNIYVPSAFRDLLDETERTDASRTPAWDFYRGKAETSESAAVIDLLNSHDVRPFEGRVQSDLNWSNAIEPSRRSDRLLRILEQECAFLVGGGVLLSRTSRSHRAIRDSGVVTIDIGNAELTDQVHERLTDVGYGDPAGFCAFGISTVSNTVDGLADNLLADYADFLVYRIGR